MKQKHPLTQIKWYKKIKNLKHAWQIWQKWDWWSLIFCHRIFLFHFSFRNFHFFNLPDSQLRSQNISCAPLGSCPNQKSNVHASHMIHVSASFSHCELFFFRTYSITLEISTRMCITFTSNSEQIWFCSLNFQFAIWNVARAEEVQYYLQI